MKYLITYYAAGLPNQEFPLNAPHIEHHFSCLEGDLRRDLTLKNFQMRVSTALAGELSTSEVDLTTSQDPDLLSTALADSLRNINYRTAGLCFVMKQLP